MPLVPPSRPSPEALIPPNAPAGSDDGLQVRDLALVSLLRLDGGKSDGKDGGKAG